MSWMDPKLEKILQRGPWRCYARRYGVETLYPEDVLHIYQAIMSAPESTSRKAMEGRILREIPGSISLSNERINRALQLLRKAGLIAHHSGPVTSCTGGWRPVLPPEEDL